MKNLPRDTSRAERRADIARLKKNRKNYYRHGTAYGKEGIRVMSPKGLGQVSQYPSSCSCPMCGNSRKHFGAITLKEKLHIIDIKLYLKGAEDGMI